MIHFANAVLVEVKVGDRRQGIPVGKVRRVQRTRAIVTYLCRPEASRDAMLNMWWVDAILDVMCSRWEGYGPCGERGKRLVMPVASRLLCRVGLPQVHDMQEWQNRVCGYQYLRIANTSATDLRRYVQIANFVSISKCGEGQLERPAQESWINVVYSCGLI